MNGVGDHAGLARALALSHEMLAVAEQGDVRTMVSLDAERMRLLESQDRHSATMGASERGMLQEIASLNDQAIGLLEHRRRRIEREMDTAAVGRRAMAAYSTSGPQR